MRVYDRTMATDGFGPWAPLTLFEVRQLFDGCPAPWWITGGHALELHTGRSWRAHDDTDVGIRRVDAHVVLRHLADRGWETVVAAAGRVSPWDGGPLEADANQNNVWCRRSGGPWRLDLTVGDGDDATWIYRRDRSLRRPWNQAVLESEGLRYLAPDLQLLFKSTHLRTKDSVDADEVIPALHARQVALLHVRLPADHPWRATIDRHRRPVDGADVVEVLDLLERGGVEAWVDGGWAVDALVGHRTRHHADLDLAVRSHQFAVARQALADGGFQLARDDGPHNVVVLDERGLLVDLHAFDDSITVVDADGIERCAGNGLAYEAHGFEGIGTIDGHDVRCISPDTLVRYHTGYDVDADDWHDVRLLHEHFGIPVPMDYQRFAAG